MSNVLPKLNATPSHELTIPSTQRTVSYRPYLVKEEKILLLAFESKDQKAALKAMINTIEACVSDTINVSKLTMFDIEYMFTQIRSKSVGESTKIMVKCSECEHGNEVSVDLSQVSVDVPDIDNNIKISDEITIEAKYPSFEVFINNWQEEMKEAELTYKIVNHCIGAVITKDARIDAEDVSEEEIAMFVESMNAQQFKKLTDFVSTMPTMKKDISFTCGSCSHNNEQTLAGISDFFS